MRDFLETRESPYFGEVPTSSMLLSGTQMPVQSGVPTPDVFIFIYELGSMESAFENRSQSLQLPLMETEGQRRTNLQPCPRSYGTTIL